MKLKAGTLSKEELVETLMGTTPLKQISKRIDVEWEDPVVPRYNGPVSYTHLDVYKRQSIYLAAASFFTTFSGRICGKNNTS